MSAANHYEVLGVAATAPVSVIRAAHRAQMREHHPDAGGTTDAKAKSLNEALRILADAALRADYDAKLAYRDASARQPARGPLRADPAARAQGARARSEAAARANARWFQAQDPALLAGVSVFARNRIDLSTMDWHRRDYPPLEIRDEPARRVPPARLFAWFLVDINLVLACLVIAGIIQGSGSPPLRNVLLLVALVPLAALIGGWGRARARGRGLVCYVLFLAHAGAILVPALADGRLPLLVALAWLGLYVLTIETLRATAPPRRTPRTRRLLSDAEITQNHGWEPAPGEAGRLSVDGAVPAARIAELLTGQLLQKLRRLPGSRILGPVAVPGSPGQHVGHAVLCGKRLALIDSRGGPGGEYYWWENAVVCKLPGHDPRFLADPFPNAVANYRRLFPDLLVRGWSVFHSSDGRQMLTNNQAAGELPRLATAETALREVGNWLAAGEPHIVDREALSALVLGFGRDEPLPDRPSGAAAGGKGTG